ncbi:MAG: polyprenyl glycosylphosphotransferase [Bacteroidetes bacterium GWC2_33_15]|nr:MAG: polyprenyl glycosylphosphotransferase [Bacteroidetes bacterium GWA2_33_15]OFX50064.1 MAG: polyprenyl glycosylphosphotransferase [Bacteroidetes bacterium GWC2_33_15]OFX65217.1 MAG: polyprenyl glycosylphosphotransferase [Bacteroidetes bacterium GWB2_32_14]OFX70443.1 MAG: polyprenyl glycosylphosphotransferase [Bacteroidetes bacterium GWD2_33_33]HAN19686.1 sugar transferase [Bacteroidales bacterium]
MSKTLHTIKYILFDFFSAVLSWAIFYSYRKIYIETEKFGIDLPLEFTSRFYHGIILIPVFWLFLYYLSGYYKDIYRKSRLKELGQTFFSILLGSLILFFTSILDDEVITYQNYYSLFFTLITIQFIATYIPRLVITTRTNNKIHKRIFGFNTLIIGGNKKAVDIYQNIENQIESTGNKFIGFISLVEKEKYILEKYLPRLGELNNVPQIIDKYKIEEVIIALESTEHREIEKIINSLDNKRIIIKAIPSMYDILTGKVKMAHIFGTPLIQISHSLMPTWQEHAKQAIDFALSLIALVISSPLILFLAIGIKLTSKGPIVYSHERIGRFGKPFTLYKFRSMYEDAESNGPALSSINDERITPFGKFMRKSKLDELPNFYNVLKGDMSLVGPRPERKFYIDQIVSKAPHYLHLQKVKPGITSWGQVKFGYAENVDQMVERLKYDILYIENMSLYVDFKIMIYTILIILKGRHI